MSDRTEVVSSLLHITSLHKHYGETHALRGIDFEARRGEIHAVVGENGAGKSTLMRILSGAERPDAGSIQLDGVDVELSDPLVARDLGIHAVYQEFSLVPHLSVAENVLLGDLASGHRFRFDRREVETRAHQLLDSLGFHVDVTRRVDQLSVSQRQMVEIAKGVTSRPRIVMLDEPSAVLSTDEMATVFSLVRKLAAEGTLVLYVSHRLDEVFEIADRITVLKDGERVRTVTPAEIDQRGLINLMVGRPVEDVFPEREAAHGEIVVQTTGLGRAQIFADVDLTLRSGEILGLFGLVGCGRTELARALVGAEPADTGAITLSGAPYRPTSPGDALEAGVAYLTEDRARDGLILVDDITTNMTLAVLRRLTRRSLIDPRTERERAKSQMKALSVRAPGPHARVGGLSGGNQQKVLLARWLLTESKVLLLDEPTRGVDVGTKIEIYRLIAELAAGGAAVMLISSELPEILGLSHRILVMRQGQIVAEEAAAHATESTLLAAASGVAA